MVSERIERSKEMEKTGKNMKVSQYMTRVPSTIGSDIHLDVAVEKMKNAHCRHLPVKYGGKLVGILSDRDVKLAGSFGALEETRVDEVMTPEPYTCHHTALLSEVTLEMAKKGYGSAIVTNDNEEAIGIFTVTDALYALSDLLK